MRTALALGGDATRRPSTGAGASPSSSGAAEAPRATETLRPPTRVLVADQHEATRAGTKAALDGTAFVVVAECCDAEDAITSARRTRPDICLVDLGLPGGGLVAATSIASLPSRPRVVAVAASVDDDQLFAALAAGAAGCLLKDVGCERLPLYLEDVAAGHVALSPPLVSRLVYRVVTARRAHALPAEARLSDREGEVIRLLGERLTTKQIANRLGLRPTTVRRHISSALRKPRRADPERRGCAPRRRSG